MKVIWSFTWTTGARPEVHVKFDEVDGLHRVLGEGADRYIRVCGPGLSQPKIRNKRKLAEMLAAVDARSLDVEHNSRVKVGS